MRISFLFWQGRAGICGWVWCSNAPFLDMKTLYFWGALRSLSHLLSSHGDLSLWWMLLLLLLVIVVVAGGGVVEGWGSGVYWPIHQSITETFSSRFLPTTQSVISEFWISQSCSHFHNWFLLHVTLIVVFPINMILIVFFSFWWETVKSEKTLWICSWKFQ